MHIKYKEHNIEGIVQNVSRGGSLVNMSWSVDVLSTNTCNVCNQSATTQFTISSAAGISSRRFYIKRLVSWNEGFRTELKVRLEFDYQTVPFGVSTRCAHIIFFVHIWSELNIHESLKLIFWSFIIQNNTLFNWFFSLFDS